MRLKIEFDVEDFTGMLQSFFKDAGYNVAPASLEEARSQFGIAYPEGLSLVVFPTEEAPTVSNPVTVSEPPPEPAVEPTPEFVAPTEEPRLTFTEVMSSDHSDDAAKIHNILNLSRNLEKK